MHKHKKKLPTAISILRALSIIPAIFFFNKASVLSLAILILALISDWADGFLARKWQATSEFGAFIDPLADKILYLGVLWSLRNFVDIERLFYSTLFPEAILVLIRLRPFKEWLKTRCQANTVGKIKMNVQAIAVTILIVGIIFNNAEVTKAGVLMASVGLVLSWASLYFHLAKSRV